MINVTIIFNLKMYYLNIFYKINKLGIRVLPILFNFFIRVIIYD